MRAEQIDSHPEALLQEAVTRKGFSRRQFLALAGAIAGGELVASQLGPLRRVLGSGLAGGSADAVTVMLYLGGGNDGLNTVVPLAQREYERYVAVRTKTVNGTVSSIAHPMPGTLGRPDSLLVGDANIGFNPGMGNIARWYRDGHVAVIQGVGYTNANLSHFESQEHWWGGSGAAGSPVSYKVPTGWLGRYGDLAGLNPLGSISINGSGAVNPALRGLSVDPLAISPWQGARLGDSTDPSDIRLAASVRAMAAQVSLGTLGNAWSALGGSALQISPAVTPAYNGIGAMNSQLKRQMTMAANLIGANVGTRIIHTDTGGFDTHENQRKANANGIEWHTALWLDIDDALNHFFSLLSPADRRRVNVVVYSEFGRRVEMNGTYGTDHGAASVALVIGDNVKGGTYGQYPSLFDLHDPVDGGLGGNLKATVDFRQMYATILHQWLGVEAAAVLGAAHEPLGFIAAAPGDVVGATTTTSSTTTSSTTTSTTTTSTTVAPTTSTTVAPTTSTAPSTTLVVPTTTSVVPSVSTSSTTVANPTTTVVIAVATTTTSSSTTSSSTSTTTSTVAPSTTTTAPATTTTLAATTTVAPTTSTTRSTTSTTTTTVKRSTMVPAQPTATPDSGTPDTPNVAPVSVTPAATEPAPSAPTSTTTPESTTTTELPLPTTSRPPAPASTSTVVPPTATTTKPGTPLVFEKPISGTSTKPPVTKKPPKKLALRPSIAPKRAAKKSAAKR